MSDRELEIPLPVTLERQTKDTFQRVLRALKWLRANPNSGFPSGANTGDILYFDGKEWRLLAAGTAGQVLTQAAGPVKPAWAAGASGFPGGAAQGDIVYYNGSAWTLLTAGTSGYYLKTLGAGANPVWAAVTAGGNAAIDYTVDFTSQTRDYLTGVGAGTGSPGDNPQTVPFTITANNGTSTPSTLGSGLTITPVSSANAAALTCGTTGLRALVTGGAAGKLVDCRMALAHLGIDRTRPFGIWMLLNRTHVIVPAGSEADAIIYSATCNIIMYAQHTAYIAGGVKSAAVVFVNGTYSAGPVENPESTDNVKVAQFNAGVVELYSTPDVAGAFPSSSSLASLKRRGRASGEYLISVKAAPVTFPNDDDVFAFRCRADTTSCDSAYYAMRVVQGA